MTAALFATLRDEPRLLALAARIDPERLPALLFVAAVMALIERERPPSLAVALPAAGGRQPPLPPDFAAELRAFCLRRGDDLLALAAAHRYQMSEPARCAHLLPAVAAVAAEVRRPLALVDLGTGAGFALHLDAYRYLYRRPRGQVLAVGDPGAAVTLHTTLRGPHTPLLPPAPPTVAVRIGLDTEPLDVADPDVRAWLRACTPPVAEALTRFDRAADYAVAHPATMVRADALTALPEVFDRLPEDVHPCLIDAYVHVFFTAKQRARFRDQVARLGRGRDLDWISLDPLVPMGDDPRESVLGAQLPQGLLARARDEGVFGVLGPSRSGEAEGRPTSSPSATPGRLGSNGWPECATEHPRLGTICVRRRSILASTRIDNGVTTVQSTSRTIREMGMNASPAPESRRKPATWKVSVPVPRLG